MKAAAKGPAAKKPAARKPAATKTSAKKPAAKKPAGRTPAGKRPASRAGREPELLDPLDLDGLELEDDADDEGAGSDGRLLDLDEADIADDDFDEDDDADDDDGAPALTSGPFVLDETDEQSAPLLVRFDDREVPAYDAGDTIAVERPREELLTGVAALVLAFSVFLPWFGPSALPITGWEGGLAGPIIFFFGLAVAAIVALRRFGVAVSLPVDHSAIFEGVGWLAVLGALASRLFGAEVNGNDYPASKWVYVPLLAGVAVAMLASRISSGSPFVLRPGWFDGMAGKLGAAILAVAVLGGAGFGLTGEAVPGRATQQRANPVKQYQGKLPPCGTAAEFPVPTGVELQLSFQLPEDNCNITFTSKLTLSKLVASYKTALKGAGWKFTTTPSPKAMTFMLTTPRCGTLSLNELGALPNGATPSTKGTPRITGFAVFGKTCGGVTGTNGTRSDEQPPS